MPRVCRQCRQLSFGADWIHALAALITSSLLFWAGRVPGSMYNSFASCWRVAPAKCVSRRAPEPELILFQKHSEMSDNALTKRLCCDLLLLGESWHHHHDFLHKPRNRDFRGLVRDSFRKHLGNALHNLHDFFHSPRKLECSRSGPRSVQEENRICGSNL